MVMVRVRVRDYVKSIIKYCEYSIYYYVFLLCIFHDTNNIIFFDVLVD